MAINKTKKAESDGAKYDIKVTRAKDLTKDGGTTIAFDMEVNGVSIYGCFYREGTGKNGEYTMVSFPSHKGADGKYYNYAYFKVTDEMLDDIAKQIEAVL